MFSFENQTVPLVSVLSVHHHHQHQLLLLSLSIIDAFVFLRLFKLAPIFTFVLFSRVHHSSVSFFNAS